MRIRNVGGFVASVAALALMVGGAASGASTYADATGDSGAAADMTSIAVANDDAGTITFRVSIANRPSAFNADDLVVVAIDSDRNSGTGDTDGMEYAALLGSGGSTLLKWDGTTYSQFSHGPISGSYSAGVAQISLGKADIGNVASFDFYAVTLTNSDNPADADGAPENGNFTYTLTVPVTMESANAVFAPAAPRTGKVFAVAGVVVHLSDRTSAKASSFACTGKLAGKTLKPLSKCRWKLPKKSKGKKFVVVVSLTYKGERGTLTPYSFKVR